jgi:hypothetical protein
MYVRPHLLHEEVGAVLEQVEQRARRALGHEGPPPRDDMSCDEYDDNHDDNADDQDGASAPLAR